MAAQPVPPYDCLVSVPDLHRKLEIGARLLDLIDQRRTETDSPELGAAIERAIVDGGLEELEEDGSGGRTSGTFPDPESYSEFEAGGSLGGKH